MKRILSAFFCIILIICLFAGCSENKFTPLNSAENGSIRVVSFNCASPWGSIANGTLSSSRVKKFASYMNSVSPDSIGTQEMNQKWLDRLAVLMSDYDSYGVIRGGDENENKSEMNAVFWLKNKYAADDKGTFWLSETHVTESKYEGAGCYRICSWVLLRNLSTGEKYIHMNTHLDNASEEAANYGASVISQKIDTLKAQYGVPIVLTGDFNETEEMSACVTISEKLQNARKAAEITESKLTYHDWGNIADGEPIDFIFTEKESSVSQYKTLDDTSNGYVSDHFGIMADIKL